MSGNDRGGARRIADRLVAAFAERTAGNLPVGAEDVRRLVREAQAPRSVEDALLRLPRRATTQDWVALAVLVASVRDARARDSGPDDARARDSGPDDAARDSAPDEFMDPAAFASLATELGLSANAGTFLYAQAAGHWARSRPPADAARSPVSTYLALHRFGLINRAELLRWPDEALGQSLGMSAAAARWIHQSAIRNAAAETPYDFVALDVKAGKDRCCPPLDDPRFRGRFDYFGENSRLSGIVASLRLAIQDRIKATFATHITTSVRDAARAFGVGDASLYDTGAAGPPFNASHEQIQTIDDLKTKATRPDAEAWLANIRRQMAYARTKLKVNQIESYIKTSHKDQWNTGDGDGSAVRLEIRGSFGAVNVAPAPQGGGFPIDSSNYNDGGLAFEFFGTAPGYQTPIPLGDGTIPALDVTGFRMTYASSNAWFFESSYIYFKYEVNGHSRLLTKDQPTENVAGGGDLVHSDEIEGWVNLGDEFGYNIVPSSHLAIAKYAFSVLSNALDDISSTLTASEVNNVYLVKGDEIVAALRDAAVHSREGEHELARSTYARVLATLSALDQDNLTALDRELLFAIHVLIAASYVASDALPPAYASLVEAANFTVDDPDGLAYLWHVLADLFQRWGDQIYAAAGRDYEARLLALDRYRKVTAPEMYLTYDDGREDEVLDLWLDFAVTGDAVPADRPAWVNNLRVRLVAYSGATPVYGDPLPILDHETVPPAGGKFIRVRLDVSESRLRRGDLNFVVSNSDAVVQAWEPSDVRLQARVGSYNPFATIGQLRGVRQDILAIPMALPPPVHAGGLCSWSVEFAAVASFHRVARVPAPSGCATGLRQRIAQQRVDQIRAHLNVYGLHDEYVPNGRFVALQRLASGLAERAAYFWSRYVDFLARAEAAALEELDVAFMLELSRANVSLAQDRLAQADLAVEAAVANVAATGVAFRDAEQTLSMFRGSYEIGLVRFMNSVSLSYPPAVSMNLGGFVGTVTGADGYDQQFRTRELDYAAAVDRAQTAAQAADFHRRLSELERLVAEDSLTIEQMRHANAIDRLEFLRDRALSASAWYAMAGIYRELAEAKVVTAGRWAWMAERALEFEINTPVTTIRMDYHLLPLGSEKLRSDLDQLNVVLADFRERYRDIPNVIQREFRFSTDFPQQFRALTSTATAAPAVDIGHGVRAVEFRTRMADYDSRFPGRYAFGRILGVEVELQTDIAPGVITGHIENAREVTATVDGKARAVQVSQSLVRVPVPAIVADEPWCPRRDDLYDSRFSTPLIKEGEPPDLVDDHVSIEDTVTSVVNVALAAAPSVTAVSRQAQPSRQAPVVRRARAIAAVFEPLVAHMLEPYRPPAILRDDRPEPLPAAAGNLLARAGASSVTPAEIAYAADSLSALNDREPAETVYARRGAQLSSWGQRFAARGFDIEADDVEAFIALRGQTGLIGPLRDELNRLMFIAPGVRGWQRYEWAGEFPLPETVSRDVSTGHGALRTRPLDILPDYLTHPSGTPAYGLRLKRHDADSLTISAYRVREDAVVFNPYNPGEQLGVFENTGIDTDWRLTLRALPANPLNSTPQWDKIREIVLRVWYHAAYERLEGYRLCQLLEPQIARWNAEKLLALSLYRDFYDEFTPLLGDYDEHDPTSLAAVRAFTDEAPSSVDGWIKFTIDRTLLADAGRRVSAITVAFVAPEPSVFPAYVWRLRRGTAGPVVQGTATEAPGPLTARLSAAAPAGLGGLEAGGDWYLRLARADNPNRSLGPLRDIEILIELEPV